MGTRYELMVARDPQAGGTLSFIAFDDTSFQMLSPGVDRMTGAEPIILYHIDLSPNRRHGLPVIERDAVPAFQRIGANDVELLYPEVEAALRRFMTEMRRVGQPVVTVGLEADGQDQDAVVAAFVRQTRQQVERKRVVVWRREMQRAGAHGVN